MKRLLTVVVAVGFVLGAHSFSAVAAGANAASIRIVLQPPKIRLHRHPPVGIGRSDRLDGIAGNAVSVESLMGDDIGSGCPCGGTDGIFGSIASSLPMRTSEWNK